MSTTNEQQAANSRYEGLGAALQALIQFIVPYVQDGLQKKTIQPDYDEIYQKTWWDFQYTPAGVDVGGGIGGPLRKPDWHNALDVICQAAAETPAYQQALQILEKKTSDSFNPQHSLERFIYTIAIKVLDHPNRDQVLHISDLIQKFIHQLHTGEANAHASIYLVGITLASPKIQLTPGIEIRQSTVDDLSFPRAMSDEETPKERPFPTAVIEINTPMSHGEESRLQQVIGYTVSIIQLSGVGGILKKYDKVESDAMITDVLYPGISWSTDVPHTSRIFYLDERHERKLPAFFKFMMEDRPTLAGLSKNIDYLNISFERYLDACTDWEIIERQVMNAIMGLEAHYLNENMELSFKLRMRCSKAMSFCGFNPLQVEKTLKAGYEIRSTFAHGDRLSKKNLAKLDKQFNGLQTIGTRLCDYLRISICATIILALNKDLLIESLDKALLVEAESARLAKEFEVLQQYISPTSPQ